MASTHMQYLSYVVIQHIPHILLKVEQGATVSGWLTLCAGRSCNQDILNLIGEAIPDHSPG